MMLDGYLSRWKDKCACDPAYTYRAPRAIYPAPFMSVCRSVPESSEEQEQEEEEEEEEEKDLYTITKQTGCHVMHPHTRPTPP